MRMKKRNERENGTRELHQGIMDGVPILRRLAATWQSVLPHPKAYAINKSPATALQLTPGKGG